jgi:hypothetical protein
MPGVSLEAVCRRFDAMEVAHSSPGHVVIDGKFSPRTPRGKIRGPKPGKSPRITTRYLQERMPSSRLNRDDRAEAERQCMNAQVHAWLLRHSATAVPRAEMSRERKQVLRDTFRALDADDSSTIDEYELGLAMKALGFSNDDMKQALEIGDQNRDGQLSFDEFVALFTYAWCARGRAGRDGSRAAPPRPSAAPRSHLMPHPCLTPS